MKKCLCITFFIIAFVCVLYAEGENTYEDLLEFVLHNNADVEDYRRLRFAYTETEFYNPYNLDIIDEMQTAYQSGDYNKIIELVEANGKSSFVLIDLHFYAMKVYEAAGNEDLARRHASIALGLIKSIIRGADGLTPETAYNVINVREEYIILGYLKLEHTMQSFTTIDGTAYDVFNVKSADSPNEYKVYINIQIPMVWLEHTMQDREE